MERYATSPLEIFKSLWRNRSLAIALSKREIIGRYRGSVLGLLWAFINPLLMLAIYTFVFSVVFKARWGAGYGESKTEFALILFIGLIIHGVFADCVNRAPTLILYNINYVKKVIFPLEILPWVNLSAVVFHALVSIIVLLVAQLAVHRNIPYTVVFLPLVLLPLLLATMGFSWLIASLGVYLRDIGQVTGVFTVILLFLSPVFYPLSMLPARYQGYLELNPLAFIIEEGRKVLIFGQLPDFGRWTISLAAGMVLAWAGFAWFQKTRRGFADVV